MQSEQEVKELKEELLKLTGFIGDFGTDIYLNNKDVQYACNVCDALAWVLGEISTERFRSSDYTNFDNLKHITGNVETTTGKKLADQE
jgi:hypothetical protein